MTLEHGTQVGPYEIVALLGAGGMGEVYRARDPRLRRDVAIKILPTAFARDGDRLRRFEQEAHASGSLNHPNIVGVYDFGLYEGSPYVVTELLLGETLRARLERGPLSPRRAIEISLQLARGLTAAHQKGIVHRDLKPENIFLTDDGRVKILDFGLAKPARAHCAAAQGTQAATVAAGTEPGMILGTAGYMSPEQVRGAPADARSDIFSFGVVLFEMLAGRQPFEGASAVETMNAILKDELPELSAPVPAAVDRVIRHAVEKDPEDRFQSARDLGFALEALSAILTDPSSQAQLPALEGRRWTRGWQAPVLAALVAGLVVGVALSHWLLRPRPAEPPAFRYLTYSGHDYAPAASPHGRILAFTSDRDGVPRIWLKQLGGGEERPLTTGPDDLARISPDGSMVLYTHTEGARTSLYRIPLLGGDPRKLVEDAAEGDWSPDASQVAFVRWKAAEGRLDSEIGVVAAAGSGERVVASFPDQKLARVRWSPDGKLLAFIQLASSGALHPIWLMAPDGAGRRNISPPRAGFAISSPAWLGSAEELVYFQSESALEGGLGTNAGTANVIRQNVRTGETETLAWTPESGMLLDVAGDGRIVYDACSPRASLREIRLPGGPSAARWLTRGNSNDRQPAYSPDGDWIIFSSNRSGNLDLWQISTRTETVRRITEDPAEDWDPVFAADGRRIFWSSNRSGNFEIWTANADGSGARQLSRDGVDAENPTATPDGWVIYVSTSPEKAGIWKIRADGSSPARLVAGNYAIPEVSSDGRCVLYCINYLTERVALRVADVATGAELPFEIKLGGRTVKQGVGLGRARWMPGGRAIAFIGQDEKGVNGVFVQDFVPGKDTAATRRPLGGFDPELITESFGISPDGKRLAIASWEQLFSLMLGEHLPGIVRGR